jgi:hypothetical protein
MAESGNMFFDQYNKVFPEMQEKVVPLAMKKMELDMETEKFNMAKQKIIDDRQKAEDFAKYIQGEEVTNLIKQPDIQGTKFKTSFGAELPVSEGVEGLTTAQTSLRPRTEKELADKALSLGLITPEKYLEAFKTKNDTTTEIKNYEYQQAHPGFNPNKEKEKDQWSEPYEDKIGGKKIMVQKNLSTGQVKPVAQDVSTTIRVTNTGVGGGYTFKPGTLDYMAEIYEQTGQVPAFGMGTAGMKARAEFFNKIAERAANRNDTGAEQVARAAETKANTSALTDLTKREQLIESYNYRINETSDKVLIPLIKKWDMQNPRFANWSVNKFGEKVMGSGDLASLKLALNSVSNEVGKVEFNALGIQELSNSASDFMKSVHDENMKVSDLLKVVDTSKQLGQTGKSAIAKQRSDLRVRMKNNVPKDNTTPKATHRFIPGQGIVEIK